MSQLILRRRRDDRTLYPILRLSETLSGSVEVVQVSISVIHLVLIQFQFRKGLLFHSFEYFY